jgi:hypothetical protein
MGLPVPYSNDIDSETVQEAAFMDPSGIMIAADILEG